MITNLGKWKYIYEGIDKSKFNGIVGLPSVKSLIDSNSVREKHASSLVGLSILFYRGDYLPDTVIKDMMIANDFSNPAYQTMYIFAGTTLLQKVYNGTVYYHYSPNLLFSNINDEINEIWVDFEDGIGYRFLNKDLEQTFVINYNSTGERSMRFKVYTDSDTLTSYSRMNIVSLQLDEPDFVGTITAEDTAFTLFNTAKSITGSSFSWATYSYREGCDGILNKAVIICEGFNILGDQTIEDLEAKWSSTIADLRGNGYDIFLVNIETPENDMYVSADLIKTLVKGINDIKQDNFESIYIGESMGGILGRISLKELENEGNNHQVGLYISYDSPHKGAFIPEGLQYAITNAAFVSPVFQSYYYELLSIVFGFDYSITDLIAKYASVGAAQLMANHVLFQGIHSNFQNSIDNLGYPTQCRNITFSNGSNRGTLQNGVMPGNQIFSITQNLGVATIRITSWYTIDEPNHQLVYQFERKQWLGSGFVDLATGYVTSSYRPYTNAPGGYIANSSQGIYSKFTFVPTASAIDLDASLWNAGNYTFLNENYPATRGKDALIDNNLTPFDDIYADWDNTEHVLYHSSELDYEIKTTEIMPEKMYIQNKYFSFLVDFEATNFIVAGRNVDNQIYDDSYYSYQKHINEGDVIIKSGSTVYFRAGNEIILSDGFTAEEGSVFHAEVGIVVCDPNNRQSIPMPSNSKIQVDAISCNQFYARMSASSDETNYFWTLTGEDFSTNYSGNEIQIDNLQAGQYTLYCSIDFGGSSIDTKIIEVQCPENNTPKTPIVQTTEPEVAPQFYVYPNPTIGLVNIIPDHLAANEEYTVVVSDIFGKTLVSEKSNETLKIGLSVFTPGVYLIFIKNENYESTRKIIKY